MNLIFYTKGITTNLMETDKRLYARLSNAKDRNLKLICSKERNNSISYFSYKITVKESKTILFKLIQL